MNKLKNFFTKIGQGLKTAFGFGKTFYVRAGLGQFLDTYAADALVIITKLASVNNNAAFNVWKDQAFAEVKSLTKATQDNWVAILIHAVFELYKGNIANVKEAI